MGQRVKSDGKRGHGWLLVAAMVVAGCGGAEATETNEAAAVDTTITELTTTTTGEPTTTSAVPSTTTTAPSTTSTTAEPEAGVRSGDVILGEAEIDLLDPIVTLTADEPWNVHADSVDGAIILQDPELVSEYTRGLMLLEATKPFGASIDEWADANEAATIESRAETQVGGLDAIVYDISYVGDNDLAILTAPCCGGRIIVRNTEYYRVWMIETGRDRPFALFSAVLTDDIEWLDKAERLVATVEFDS
ncbi:MAG: hypothetical protein HKN94_03010 [Acidimicrobiales bacterium]|nr:hypothetical protein [Acidimicrobiales bacterium]RZV48671.1 MAG: hypothetical protein EX269_00940 [Acidimicrobiales bacterium]